MPTRQCLVTCTVSPGLFNNEFEVTLPTLGPDGTPTNVNSVVSGGSLVFVSGSQPGESESAQLRVWCLDRSGDSTEIVLPQTTNDSKIRVKVPNEQVKFED